jgi:hypothetical protein
MLTTVYEILADPQPRPSFCIYLVEEFLEKIKRAEEIAKINCDDEMSRALDGLRNAAVHYRKESIASSIRKLATKTSIALGDPDPEATAKKALALYGRRSGLVHKGEIVSSSEVVELRKLVRETLAVEVGCFDHIRERYP